MSARRLAAKACLLASLVLAVAGCGGAAPQAAQFVPPAPSTTDLSGSLRARYNLLPTLALGEAVAREYGVERDEGTALLVVALRRVGADGEETSVDAEVSAEAVDLGGRRQQVALRKVATGDYVDHVGTMRVGRHDTIRVQVGVVADGRRQQFDFQRNF
ncbi:DUF4426 domain-containing protein [Pseudoxanthomonas suwonensis]|uniref:DUF4426 domain-containing protein n=1 Tax=Pseudoxanthomonas suwonensis TaxID=314722 RepID=UPI0004662A6F|nr:DUF4426 domain-containing protein [Pseudoxanthomonas suwonensis]